ncbi:hypothetical protein RZS08_62775, partial [Arthrospira platensis SPKY1]|nr:hypothetical protein [Arthrospira platensis SPKY1]
AVGMDQRGVGLEAVAAARGGQGRHTTEDAVAVRPEVTQHDAQRRLIEILDPAGRHTNAHRADPVGHFAQLISEKAQYVPGLTGIVVGDVDQPQRG